MKSIRASARASRLTGAPMTFHMGGGTPEEKQQTLDIVASEGVDLNHVVMGHNGSGDVAVMKQITIAAPTSSLTTSAMRPKHQTMERG